MVGQKNDISTSAKNTALDGKYEWSNVDFTLKEYYEIVDEAPGEARPLSVFFPTHADLFT